MAAGLIRGIERRNRQPMRWFLSPVSYLLFWLAFPFFLTHPKLRRGLKARMGWAPLHLGIPTAASPRIWVHGASAGDVLALLPLVKSLHRHRPELEIVGSTITDSGHAILQQHRESFAAVTYAPFDIPGAVARTFRKIQPQVLVLEYTELWPQLLRHAHRHDTAVILHNGRLSARHLNRYRWLFRFTGNLLSPLRWLLMRDSADAERALRLGAKPESVRVTGNTKFDNLKNPTTSEQVESLRAASGFGSQALIWIAGSTHEGEEERLLDVFCALKKDHPQLRMVIAPRYVDRVDRIESLLARRNLIGRRRSSPPPAPENCEVLILDTIGELAACYALADVAFVGGSFIRRGGQNLLEPAVCGTPVLFGPHTENFVDAVQLLLGRGGIRVEDQEQLHRVLRELLDRPDYRKELGSLAAEQVKRAQGAAERNASFILDLV